MREIRPALPTCAANHAAWTAAIVGVTAPFARAARMSVACSGWYAPGWKSCTVRADHRTIDRYVLHEPIAVGGMATVYFAHRRGAAGFGKTVAVKRMRPDLVHQREFIDLFLDEARLASHIDHVNVVSVLDVVSDEHELFIVMEYIHGESFSALMKGARASRDQVPPNIVAAVVSGALHGLHAAHEATNERREPLGIVHRDVSPHNLIVGVDGVPRVVDFGVAKATGQLHSTIEGRTRGKARYMAPEQIRGRPVSRQTDIFASSVMLWEALVGEALFERETDAAAMHAILEEPITAPGVLVPSLPEAIDEVVMRGLERDPKNRWATARDMALALEAALPIATPAVVGAWVSKTAHDTLEKRRRVVDTIASEIECEAVDQDAKEHAREHDERHDESPDEEHEGTTRPRVLGPSAMAEQATPPPLLQSRRIWPLLLGVAIAMVVTPMALRAGRGRSEQTNVRLPTLAVSAGPNPLLTATSSATASSATSPAPAPSATAMPSRHGIPTLRPHKKACDPPYDVSPTGRKIFKMECL
jgi:serine/threonine-protein kinase